MIQKAYKFRIYPNKTQEVLLNKTFGCTRFAWNSWVENFNKQEDKVFKTPKEFKKEIIWMKEVSSAAIQQKEQDFREFKNQFFNKDRKKKLGRPQFKSKIDRQSYRLPNQKFFVNQETNKVRIEKIGWVKTVFDRVIPQDVKFINITISKDTVGDYFVSITVEENIIPTPKANKAVGVDVGINALATLSTGKKFENQKCFRENQSEIKKIQQHLSRKVKGSKNYQATKKALSKMHRRIARQRAFYLYNLSSFLVKNFDVIAIEDLNINGMLKNHCLALSISDAAWGMLFRQIIYKSEWQSKTVLKCERFEPTSKTCCVCGYYNKDLTLSDREWVCPNCGTFLDRDENAAKNILKNAVGVETALQMRREDKTSLANINEAFPFETSSVL